MIHFTDDLTVWSCIEDDWKLSNKMYYKADVSGNAGMGLLRRTYFIGVRYIDFIGEIIQKGRVRV